MNNTQKEGIYTELRKLINDGFKEYDGDIREMALEELTKIEQIGDAIKAQFDEQAHNVDNAYKDVEELKLINKKIEEDKLTYQAQFVHLQNELKKAECALSIDFGTAKLYYRIEAGGTVTLDELMQTLRDAAMIVPLQQITRAIKRSENY